MATGFMDGTFNATLEGVIWKITFDTGSLTVTRGGELALEGTYRPTNDEIVFTDGEGPRACKPGEKTGKYRWRRDADLLTFTVVEDKCAGRIEALTTSSWSVQQ